MPVLERIVRRLRLAATREDHARHGRILLEDALRTASFGDDTRLIIVRRLDLGQVSSRAPATSWSRRLEETFRKTSINPVSIHDRAAATAPAIYFKNYDEPWLQLAHRTLINQPCSEWFWRFAVPDWKPSLSAPDTLRLCVRTLATRGGLSLTLQLITHLPRGFSPEALYRSLEPADFAAIRDSLGFPLSFDETDTPASPATASTTQELPPLTDLERRFVAIWGPTDIRTHWLAAARLTAVNPARFSVAPLPSVTTPQIQQLVRHWHRESASNHPFLQLCRPPSSVPGAPAARRHSDEAINALPTLPLRSSLAPEPATLPPPDFILERLFTQAGGLFFLIPLLQRAGLPACLETLPPAERAALPWQLFKVVLRHTRTASDDTLTAALRDLPATQHPLGRWLILVNRHALRLGSLSLRQIVQRPALVALNGTHIDVFFRVREADLRLRRAGLDLDPGWVPWLGRAVAYHFNRED